MWQVATCTLLARGRRLGRVRVRVRVRVSLASSSKRAHDSLTRLERRSEAELHSPLTSVRSCGANESSSAAPPSTRPCSLRTAASRHLG